MSREDAIQRIGRAIHGLMGEETPAFFARKRWAGKMMEWAMKDESFKVRLFRFIDVLPVLGNDAGVVRLFKEYFEGETNLPFVMRKGMDRLSRDGLLPGLAGRMIRSSVETLARDFIAGSEPESAFATVQRLRKEGLAASLDILGEEVLSEAEASRYREQYLRLIEFLSRRMDSLPPSPLLDHDSRDSLPKVDLSLKVTSFYSQCDPLDWAGSMARCAAGLEPVVNAAVLAHASITFDMEHYSLKDLIIELFRTTIEDAPSAFRGGIALQAYLPETREDLLKLIAWARGQGKRITVRLVKGAYWDYETVAHRRVGWPVPVYLSKGTTDAAYEELSRILLTNVDVVRAGFATHNIRSISNVMAVAEELHLPRDAFEFQMIYGMAEPVRAALRRMDCRVRVYTPVGELVPGMGYLIRRLLENTANQSFLRQSFHDKTPFDELIRPPIPMVAALSPEPTTDEFRNEPPLDFSRSDNRRAMAAALAKVPGELGREYPLVVGSREVRTRSRIVSVNPARPEQVIGTVSSASRTEGDAAVEHARSAWNLWRSVPAEERAHYLFTVAESFRRDRCELAALEVFEVGKTWTEADGDVAEAIDFLEYYGREMKRIAEPRVLGRYPGEHNEYRYDPRGIGVVLSPWNFPLAIPTGMVAAALVTGNCVILKPSGLSPVCGSRIVEAFRRAGLPSGVLQFLPGPGNDLGEYLVSHPGIDFVVFTGSREVGLRIIQRAGETRPGQRNVKRVVAEMGGKNAVIVDETADPDEAVRGVLDSALGFQGQKCSACSRVVVLDAVHDAFCSRLKAAMASVSIGDPQDPRHTMGPVIDEQAREKIQKYVDLGHKEGKPLLVSEASGPGYFVGPAVFTDVSPNSALAQEEIFGPVVAVLRARTIDHAFEIANGTEYALTGGIFSRSPVNIRRAREEFLVGNLYINRKITGALVGRQPFGGFRMSGVGSKAGGPDYLLQFLHARSIGENTLRRGFAPDIDGP